MRSFVSATLALGLVVVAAPGAAQTYVVPSQVRPYVTGYSPPSGPPDTIVTITGGAFGPGVRVLCAGRPVAIEYQDDSTIQFRAPARRGAAAIVVRGPRGEELQVGTFTVVADLDIDGFAPASGPPGTRVEITGTGFARGDVVALGAQPVPVVEGSRGHLVVTVPPGAKSDVFVLTRPGTGLRAVSARPFTVTALAPPFVTGLAPAVGPPGTPVRISGGNFSPDDEVSYGQRSVPVVARTDRVLDVVVPAEARRSHPFVVRGPRGEASSPVAFQLGERVAVLGFAPPSGPSGTRVTLDGDGFLGGDDVRLGERSLPVLSRDDRRLVVEIPNGARSDVFTVYRAGRPVASSAAPFEVVFASRGPVVTGFTPPSGPPGTQVTITGLGFGPDVRVSYDGQALPIFARDRGALTVQVPRGAVRSASFVVATRLGDTRSGSWFQLALAPVIESVTPTSGAAGTIVTVRAPALRGDEVFYLSDQPMRNVERQPWGLRVEVPSAPSGPISVESGGQRYATPFRFDVAAPLVLASFYPFTGPPGTRVVLRGENLGAVGLVSYGGLPCAILRRGGRELVIEIPDAAAGSDYLWLDAYGQRIRSNDVFRVGPAGPSIGTFMPLGGPPGTQVLLAVSGLPANASVRFAGAPCLVTQRGAEQIVFVVPTDASGRAPFEIVLDDGARLRTRQAFEVTLGRESPF